MTTLKVLVPLDGTEFSRQIIPHLKRFFRPDDVQVHLLHVTTAPEGTAEPYAPALWNTDVGFFATKLAGSDPDEQRRSEEHPLHNESTDDYRAGLERDLESQAAQLKEAGYAPQTSVHFGDPAREIIDFAVAEEMDVVAMVTHGREGLGRLFQGSVAETVLRHLSVPMLLVRAEESEGE